MCEKINVWHTKFGQGIIILENAQHYEVQFDTGIKKISDKSWLKFLFLCKEDALIQDKTILISKYEKYKKEDNYKQEIYPEDKNVKPFILENMIDESDDWCEPFLYDPFKQDIEENSVRSIFILSNKIVNIKNRQYLNIVALDINTGKILCIVDTNGMKLALHSFTPEMSEVRENSIIQASFRLTNCSKINTLRITSGFEFKGLASIINIINNYSGENLYPLEENFNTIFKFALDNVNKSFCTIAKFTGSKLKVVKSNANIEKYQIKMDKTFVDVCDNNYKLSKKVGLNFSGRALISVSCNSEGKIKVIALKLLTGRFYSDNKLKEIKAKNSHTVDYDQAFENDEDHENDEQYFNPYLERDMIDEDEFINYANSECDDSYFYEWFGYDEEYKDEWAEESKEIF